MDEERKFNLSVDIKEKKKSGTVLMTEGSIWKKLLIFSVPLILGNLLQQLYSTVDLMDQTQIHLFRMDVFHNKPPLSILY